MPRGEAAAQSHVAGEGGARISTSIHRACTPNCEATQSLTLLPAHERGWVAMEASLELAGQLLI